MTSPARETTAAIWQWVLVVVAVTGAALLAHRLLLDDAAFSTRDHTDYYLRVIQVAMELEDGVWPRSLPEAFRGAGHAFPVYYPPFSHLLAAGINRLSGGPVPALHLAALLSMVVAAIGTATLVGGLTRHRPAAIAAAAAVVVLPYSFHTIEVRGAIAEAWAMAWFPWMLLAATAAIRRGDGPWWGPLPFAAAVLSHTAVALWAVPTLGAVTLAAAGPGTRWTAIRHLATMVILALGLTAFYWLPVLMTLGDIRAADERLMWATPAYLAAARLPFHEGTLQDAPWWPWLHLLPGVLAAAAWVRDGGRSGPETRIGWAALAGFTCLSILSRAPEVVWHLVPTPLRYIQFPERLLGIATCLFATGLGVLLARSRIRLLPPLMAATLGLAAYWQGARPVPMPRRPATEVIALLETDYPDRGFTVQAEYLPRSADPQTLVRQVSGILGAVGAGPIKAWRKADGGAHRASIELAQPGVVTLPLVAYDFLDVRVGGTSVAWQERGGLVAVPLAAGSHGLEVVRRATGPFVAGLLLALGSGAILGWRGRRRLVTVPAPTSPSR